MLLNNLFIRMTIVLACNLIKPCRYPVIGDHGYEHRQKWGVYGRRLSPSKIMASNFMIIYS